MSATASDPRPLVAVIANVQTPYRAHVHRRLVRELPEIRLASLFTHDQPDQPWTAPLDPAINPVEFGRGESVGRQAGLRFALHEWRKGGRIVAWLARERPAAVFIGGYNDLARLRIIASCRRRGIPCILFGDSNSRADTATGIKRLIKNTLVRWVVRSCRAVLPCGTLGAEYFARYGASPDRIFFHPYEPDYDLIQSIPQDDIDRVAAQFNLAPHRRRIVICARLVPWKRVDLAIDAFAAIAGDRPDWDLVIIGSGPERATLERRIPDHLSRRVIWTGFLGEQHVVSAIYRASDILLVPSDYEPWAVVVNEAAAAGLAIIATDVVGAAADLVVPGTNGERFPPGDRDALVRALLRTTAPEAIDRLKAASLGVLQGWRQRADPVEGLQAALRFSGVLPSTGRLNSAKDRELAEPALHVEPYSGYSP